MDIQILSLSEILIEEYIKPYNLSVSDIASAINEDVSEIEKVLYKQKRITTDLSIRLGIFFGMSHEFFISIQNEIDYRKAKDKHSKEYERIIPLKTNTNVDNK